MMIPTKIVTIMIFTIRMIIIKNEDNIVGVFGDDD